MTGALAPVLGRIAEIERRFRATTPPLGRFETGTVDFDAAYRAATAALDDGDLSVSPLEYTATAAAPGWSTAALPRWTGVGSSEWVYPDGGGSAVATSAVSGFPPAHLGSSLAPIGGIGTSGSVPAGVPYAAQFESAAARYGVPARLLAAVGWVESRYQPDASSPAGAQGVMQLMPVVSQHYGVDPWDPAQAIDAAGRLLAEHYARFGSWDLALAAYNAGAGAVAAAGNQPPSPGVANYVAAVKQRMEQM